MTLGDMEKARREAVPKKTDQDTKYCFGILNEWRYYRETCGQSVPELTLLNRSEIAEFLCQVVFEVREKNGLVFPPNTIYHIVCGLQRYLQCNGHPKIDFFKDGPFADLKTILDAEMKRLQKTGLRSKIRQAEPLTTKEE